MVGFIAFKLKKAGVFIMGALLGVVVVLLLYTAAIVYAKPANWVLYALMGAGGLGFGILAYFK